MFTIFVSQQGSRNVAKTKTGGTSVSKSRGKEPLVPLSGGEGENGQGGGTSHEKKVTNPSLWFLPRGGISRKKKYAYFRRDGT